MFLLYAARLAGYMVSAEVVDRGLDAEPLSLLSEHRSLGIFETNSVAAGLPQRSSPWFACRIFGCFRFLGSAGVCSASTVPHRPWLVDLLRYCAIEATLSRLIARKFFPWGSCVLAWPSAAPAGACCLYGLSYVFLISFILCMWPPLD